MSALITQALDENLKILLIAESSKFARFLISNIQQQVKIEIELVSPLDFEAKKFINQPWYKVILFFEHPAVKYLSLVEKLCFLPQKSVVIMPLTTAVEEKGIETTEWNKQLQDEQTLFSNLVKKIDPSKFILYSDLVKKDRGPAGFFFDQLQRGLLVDPNIELKMQTTDELSLRLAALLLKPQKKTILISGKSRLSGNYLQQIKRLYSNQRQLNLPIKRVQLREVNHPIIAAVLENYIQETTSEKIDHISREITTLLANVGVVGNSLKESVRGDEGFLQPPIKKKMIESWNEVKAIQKKIRLDLEHDLDHSLEESQTTVEELNLETRTIGEQIETKQPNLVNSLFRDYRSGLKQKHLQKLTKSTRVGFQKLKNQKFLFGGGILVGLTALGILVSTVIFFINLSQAQGSLLSYLESRSMPVTAQQKKLVEMEKKVDQLEGKLALINKLFSTPFFSQALQLIEVSKLAVNLTDQVEVFRQATIDFFQQVMIGEGGGSLDLVNKESIEVFKTLSLLSAELKNYSLDKLSPDQSQLIIDYQNLIAQQEKKINQFQQLSPILPKLLAQEEIKTYALVLQNNQELRPTGGFIQAVALLTFKDGSLINFQVEDVYTLDQQLKATISPPAEIKQFLGEERWFLRDSNWNPSFPESAAQIKWFLEKSIAVKVDGVIGVNLRFLEEVIGILNQVELDEYNEVLTKRNLGERMEFHSEVQLVETAQQRDYTELVLFKILSKIQYLPSDQVIPLLSSLVELADSKELLIAVFDEDIQATFESLGWNGSMVDPACPTVFDTKECLVDTLMQVEANVGVNKANYYLERQIDHSIAVHSQEILHKRVVTFKNKAQTNAWPKGPYKSFIRFYLPEQSELTDIKINGQSVDSDKLIISNELSRKVVGVLIEVAVKSELKLQLEYSLPHQFQTPFTYSFFDQKQPGARDVSPRIFLKHDPDLSPSLIAPQAEVQGDVVVFNPTKEGGHVFVGVSFE